MRKKEFNIVIILSLVLAFLSFCSIIFIFRKETGVIIEEHDEQLFSLAHSVDRNLVQKVDELTSELHFVLNNPDFQKIEERMIETGDCDEVIRFFKKSHLFTKVALEGIICTGSTHHFALNQAADREHVYTFLPNEDGDKTYVCCDETGKFSIAFQEESKVSKLTYYLLLDLNHFYDTIIPPELNKSHWVVFMDCDSGLCLQNHENQKEWIILTPDELAARQDGYTIIAKNQQAGKMDVETYIYDNYYGIKSHERIVSIPVEMTANKVLTIGIAKDSENLHKEIIKDFYLTSMICVLIVFCGLMIYRFAHKYVQKAQNEKREMELKHERARMLEDLKRAQMQNSFSQLQPHFLYNALSSIREIVMEDPEEGADLIYDFTTYLRACLKSMTAKDMITFEQELENIDAYVKIEKMRLGEKLSIVYDIKEKSFVLLPLGIQPLVENAIRHGINKKRGKTGTVWIRSYKEADCYVVEVEDNGIGFDQVTTEAQIESRDKDSTGLRNLVKRYRQQLDADVEIHSEVGVGTKVKVRIPER